MIFYKTQFATLAKWTLLFICFLLASCKDKDHYTTDFIKSEKDRIANEFVELYEAEFPNVDIRIFSIKLDQIIEKRLLELLLEKIERDPSLLRSSTYPNSEHSVEFIFSLLDQIFTLEDIIAIELEAFKSCDNSMLPYKEKVLVINYIDALKQISSLSSDEMEEAYNALYERLDLTAVNGSEQYVEIMQELSIYEFAPFLMKSHQNDFKSLIEHAPTNKVTLLKKWLEIITQSSDSLYETILYKAISNSQAGTQRGNFKKITPTSIDKSHDEQRREFITEKPQTPKTKSIIIAALIITVIALSVLFVILLLRNKSLPIPKPTPKSNLTVNIRYKDGRTEQRLTHLSNSSSIKIGRSSQCDITISDPKLSRVHASLRLSHDGLSIKDEFSVNGIVYNDAKITPGSCFSIRENKICKMGDTLFVFLIE